MAEQNQQQTRQPTPAEDIRELFSRTAKLNDAISALLAPAWGSEAGIIPPDHPLYVGETSAAADEEQGAPVDWEAIAKRRERELKKVGEARHRAEQQRDEARMWARHGYEIGQRHCSWTDHGVAPDWLTEGWPRSFDSCEHLKQAAKFDEALTRVRNLSTAPEIMNAQQEHPNVWLHGYECGVRAAKSAAHPRDEKASES